MTDQREPGYKGPQALIRRLSDEFLAEVTGLPHESLALELPRKQLNDDVNARSRKNMAEVARS